MDNLVLVILGAINLLFMGLVGFGYFGAIKPKINFVKEWLEVAVTLLAAFRD